MQRFAVIVAGGRGLRMNSEIPKQFLLLRGKPVLMHTLEAFYVAYPDMQIILVLPIDHIPTWQTLISDHGFKLNHTVVEGGAERFESVKNGLKRCTNGIVGIHDGVRPLITPELIRRCYEQAEERGSAIPVVPITQSLRKLDGERNVPFDRTGVHAVQTPQCFRVEALKLAYQKPFQKAFTDDATVYEAEHGSVHVLKGDELNLKITTLSDLHIAEAILAGTQQQG